MAKQEVVQATAQPVFGGAPYGDLMEVTGPPTLDIVTEEFGPFLRTDARTVMITLMPNHYNFIPNPAFRTDATGWEITGSIWSPDAGNELVMGADGTANRTSLEGTVSASPDGTVIRTVYDDAGTEVIESLVVEVGQTLSTADVSFPLDLDVADCRLWSASTDGLDPDQAWVGQSLVVGGTGVLRYRDTDNSAGSSYVYVGPTYNYESGGEWYETGRGSREWTFSAYMRGKGTARLVMESFNGEDGSVKSPIRYRDAPVVADPASLPYDSNIPAVVEEATGQIWELKPPPYYVQLWMPATDTDPASLTVQTDPYLLDGGGNLWRALTPVPAAAPLYENLGVPVTVTEPPLTAPPTDTYVIVQMSPPDPSRDGRVWQAVAGPFYEPTQSTLNANSNGAAFGPWVEIGSDSEEQDWTRLILQTSARNDDPDAIDFGGCHWIDARVEIKDASGLWVSALMLDPTEHPIAPYFDGGMTEDPSLDDFIWSDESRPNDCISWYFRDRISRSQWLWQNMPFLVPVARPVQVFYNDWSRPFVPGQGTAGAPPALRRGTSAKTFTL